MQAHTSPHLKCLQNAFDYAVHDFLLMMPKDIDQPVAMAFVLLYFTVKFIHSNIEVGGCRDGVVAAQS